MKTFEEILKYKNVFDASGIENPNEWLWRRINNIYYPFKKLKSNGKQNNKRSYNRKRYS